MHSNDVTVPELGKLQQKLSMSRKKGFFLFKDGLDSAQGDEAQTKGLLHVAKGCIQCGNVRFSDEGRRSLYPGQVGGQREEGPVRGAVKRCARCPRGPAQEPSMASLSHHCHPHQGSRHWGKADASLNPDGSC